MDYEQLPLRDIHLPPEPLWWPPAPGWIALVLLAVAIAAALYFWQQRRRRLARSAVAVARRELESLRLRLGHDPPESVARELSALLRRLVISLHPREETASLTGAAWLQFLDRNTQEHGFSEGAGRLIAEAPYRPKVSEDEVRPLFDICRSWIDAAAKVRS